MKKQLIDNLELLGSNKKICPYLSMQIDIPDKIILNLGKYINQNQMQDLLEEFGNHSGLSYKISINADNNLTIEIQIQKNKI
jgi:hypothetical protein